MSVNEIQRVIENTQEDIGLAKEQLKNLEETFEKSKNDEKKKMLEEKILNCKNDILESQKVIFWNQYRLNKNELQKMTNDLNRQLEKGMITKQEYDYKADKLKRYAILQELHANCQMAECDEKITRNRLRKKRIVR